MKLKILSLLVLLCSYIQSQNLQNGLHAYWSLDESSGNRVDQISSRILSPNSVGSINVTARYGVKDGTSDPKAAYFRKGCNLSGSDLGLNYNQDFTISGWVGFEKVESRTQTTKNEYIISQWEENNKEWALWLKVNSSSNIFTGDARPLESRKWQICFKVMTENGEQEICSDVRLYSDAPIFVVVNYVQSSSKLKIGVGHDAKDPDDPDNTNLVFKEVTISGAINNPETGLTLGGMQNIASALDGTIDNLGIWNRSLTDQEITLLVKRSTPFTTGTPPLKQIAFFGNSITYGFINDTTERYAETDKVEYSYPRRVQTLLNQFNYTIANYGSNGTTSAAGSQKIQDGSLLHKGYDWFSVAYGINDLRTCSYNSQLPPIVNNLETIYNSILNSGSHVKLIVLTIAPFEGDIHNACTSSLPDAQVRSRVDFVNNFIRTYAAAHPRVFLVDMFEILRNDPTSYYLAGQYNPYKKSDGIHPSQAGLDRVAKHIARIIKIQDNLCNADTDGDGICDTEDLCPNNDDLLDINHNSIPDGCDDYTPPCILSLVAYTLPDNSKITQIGNTITKTGTYNAWDAGDKSNEALTNKGFITYRVKPGSQVMVGLAQSNNLHTVASMGYAIHVRPNNSIEIWESGDIKKAGLGTHTANTVFKIMIDNGMVKYFIDGVKVEYESYILGSSPYNLDFIMHNTGAEIYDLKMNQCVPCPQDVAPYTLVNTKGISQTSTTITKTDPTAWYNAGGSFNETLSDQNFVTYKVNTGKATMVGLSTTDANSDYKKLGYALYTTTDNTIKIWNNTSAVTGSLGTYTAASEFKILRANRKVKFMKDNVLLYEYTEASPNPLILGFAMHTLGAEIIDLQIHKCTTAVCSPINTYTLQNSNGLSQTGNTISKTAVTNAWDAGASSNTLLSDKNFITYRALAGKASMVGLSLHDIDDNYTTIPYKIYTKSNNIAEIWENGALKASIGPYTSSTVFKILIDGGKVKYFRDGYLLPDESTITYTGPFVIDFSMHTTGAEIYDLEISCENSSARQANEQTVDEQQTSLEVYPNPTKDNLYIHTPCQVRITNLAGVEVLHLNHTSAEAPIYIGNLPRGSYILSMYSDNMVKSVKLVKE